MESQKKLIFETDWDILIVLDACRYDFFEECYERYMEGSLKKVASEGNRTLEWLRQTFGNRYLEDVVFVSANPYINSKGDIAGFDGTKHFGKIVDTWEGEWSDDLKTVKPRNVGKETRLAIAEHPDKQIISHFMQPHDPYLSIGRVDGGEGTLNFLNKAIAGKKNVGRSFFVEKVRENAVKLMTLIFGWKSTQKITHRLNLPDWMGGKYVAKVAAKYGKGRLKKAYKNNLKKALIEIRKIINRLPHHKIVITSDHGELLGEKGIYGHPRKLDHDILREVPWLKIKR